MKAIFWYDVNEIKKAFSILYYSISYYYMMIIYNTIMVNSDHLWWIISTYDGRRPIKMILASFQSITIKNITQYKIFIEISNGLNWFWRFCKGLSNSLAFFVKTSLILSGSIPRCIFYSPRPPKHPQDIPKTKFLTFFKKLWICEKLYLYRFKRNEPKIEAAGRKNDSRGRTSSALGPGDHIQSQKTAVAHVQFNRI